jgi:hypothetical protein
LTPAQPAHKLQNRAGFRFEDTFHHDLSGSIHDRARNTFLPESCPSFIGAGHKRVFLAAGVEYEHSKPPGAPFILRRLKELASWVGLATFEALEFFALGIHGKLALWRALQITAPFDSRLAGMDFEQLAARAQSQHDKVEQLRRKTARTALGPAAKSGSAA